jgi:hypothetical protein
MILTDLTEHEFLSCSCALRTSRKVLLCAIVAGRTFYVERYTPIRRAVCITVFFKHALGESLGFLSVQMVSNATTKIHCSSVFLNCLRRQLTFSCLSLSFSFTKICISRESSPPHITVRTAYVACYIQTRHARFPSRHAGTRLGSRKGWTGC